MSVEDVTETYVAWLNNPTVTRWLGTHRATLESQRRWVAQWLNRTDARLYAIVCGDLAHPCTARMIGSLKLELTSNGEAAVLALMIGDQDHWHHGHGTAAIGLGTNVAFGTWPTVRRVEAAIRPQNFGSLHAFERAGYTIDWPEKLWGRMVRRGGVP